MNSAVETGAQGDAATVFGALAAQRIPACLWRGSRRIDRALTGESDFDLLVAPEQADTLARTLLAAGCRRARTFDADPGLEDWFGLAGPAGPLLHFHVHYRLVAGEPRVNRYTLPWIAEVLAGRVPLAGGPAQVAAPLHEGALVLVRCSLQLRWRDRLPGMPAARALLAKVNGDLAALLRPADTPALLLQLRRWLGDDVQVPIVAGVPRLAPADLWRLRRRAAAVLRTSATCVGLRAALMVWRREVLAVLRRLLHRCGLPRLPARGPVHGGLLVALHGGAAAVRAAVADRLRRVLGGKFDVLRLPDGAARRARARGMVAIVDGAAPCSPAGSADLELAIDARAPEQQLAEVLSRIWSRL